MKCPICETTIDPDVLIPCLASDGSYCTAETVCTKCGEELELYFPLTEINGEEIS